MSSPRRRDVLHGLARAVGLLVAYAPGTKPNAVCASNRQRADDDTVSFRHDARPTCSFRDPSRTCPDLPTGLSSRLT